MSRRVSPASTGRRIRAVVLGFATPVVAGLACAAAFTSTANAAASTASQRSGWCVRNPANEETIRHYVDAYNRQDVAAAYALTTPRFVRFSNSTLRSMTRERWRVMFEDFVIAFPDERWEVRRMRSCGHLVFLNLVERGTFLAPWRFPDGTVIQSTGRSYTARSEIIFVLDRQTHLIAKYTQLTSLGFLSVGLNTTAIQAIIRAGY